MPAVFATDSEWRQVHIGAGGWVTGIDIHADGTMVARTDTAGAYIWNGASWTPLVTAYTMPAGSHNAEGVYEIRIAPSDSNIMYMEAYGNVYRSVDRGGHWTQTAFQTVWMDANGVNRMDGQKMVIDPNDPNTVYAGTQHDGLWVTRDGGNHWQQVSAIPHGTTGDQGLTGIVMNNGILYVGTAGSGVYRSIDGGRSWTALSGGPSDVGHAAVAATGELYVTGNTDESLWKFAGGTWTKLISGNVHAVAVDPADPTHVVVVMPGGSLNQSHDAGATWSGWNWNAHLESSADVPWLENSGSYMSAGGIAFDPLHAGHLYQSAGVGVWNAFIPEQLDWNTPVTWNSRSAGIENIIPNDIIAPRGGNPVFASWDRPFFEMSDVDTYASSYSGGHFSMGWSLDYASSNSSFIVGLSDWYGSENSGFSSDGGHTWQRFEGLPSFALTTIGGSIAASSPTNFIWAPAANVAPAYTLDGGATWNPIQIAGKTDWSEFHWSYYLHRTTITADRVAPNTFYLYDVSTGLYVTRDGGVNWTMVHEGQISPWSVWNATISSVPGRAGELYFTSGPQDGDPNVPADISFMHSTDGGATWHAVAGVEEVSTFGFGAARTEGGPASIYIVGFVNEVYGVWYSTDNAATWTQIGSHPMGNLDTITTISGDMDEFGVVYAGFGGNGYVYLDINAAGAAGGQTGNDRVLYNPDADPATIVGGAGFDTLVIGNMATPTHFDLVGHGFEAAERTITDSGSAPWSVIRETYTESWALRQQTVINDDGSEVTIDHDFANADSNQIWRTFDAVGRLADVDTVGSNGHTFLNIDETQSQSWSQAEFTFDAAGRLDRQSVVLDDNVRYSIDFDENNSHNWSQVWSIFDSQGRLDTRDTVNDDGSHTFVNYDQSNSFAWSEAHFTYGSDGRLQAHDVIADDGSQAHYSWDSAGNQPFQWTADLYDAQGDIYQHVIRWDDGRTDYFAM